MKKLVMAWLTVAAAALCTTASAGLKLDYYVTLDLPHLQATGAFGSARRGGGASDILNCQLASGQIQPNDLWVECMATTSAGTLDCFSSSQALISVAQALHHDSYVSFSGVSCGSGCCLLATLTEITGSILYPTQK